MTHVVVHLDEALTAVSAFIFCFVFEFSCHVCLRL
jgi:hypothetical protein